MVIAPGFHLLPFRTEKLSPVAPMVLSIRRESRSPPFFNKRDSYQSNNLMGVFFVFGEGSDGSCSSMACVVARGIELI